VFQPSTWGYPFNIAQDRGNKFTVNVWSYRRLMNVIELKAQEYGMRVFEVVEYDASKYCAYHNVKVKGHPRGAVSPKGHKFHSDLNSNFKHPQKSKEYGSFSNKETVVLHRRA
jgi:transposase